MSNKVNITWPVYNPKDAYEDGQCAREANEPISPNPFPNHPSLAAAFELGWINKDKQLSNSNNLNKYNGFF